MMKRNNRILLIAILIIAVILSTLSGCTSIKSYLDKLIDSAQQNSNTNKSSSNSEVAPNSDTVSPTSKTQPGQQEPTPTVKPAKSSTTSQVYVVSAKPASVQGPSSEAVTVSDTNAFYDLVVSSVAQGKDLTVTLQGSIQKDEIADNAIKIANDSGFSGYITNIEYSIDKNIAYIHFNYKGGKDHYLASINAVNSKVQEIVNAVVKPDMSDYDKELALHDYVVNNVNYDYENLVAGSIPDDSYTAYGALIKGTAVCQGYAESMYRLLNKAGIKTFMVTGSGNNVPHAWNIVSIGGDYYHLDATFDDPVSSSGNKPTYNYFNLSDAQISKDHSFNTANYPKCTSTLANYFVVNNLIANNKTDFYNIIKKGLLNKSPVIRCKTTAYSPSIYTPNIISDILRDNPKINYLNLTKGFFYNYDPNSFVMEIYMTYK